MLSLQQNHNINGTHPMQSLEQQQQQQSNHNVGPTIQTLRLRDEPTPVRPSRKRKSPPGNNVDQSSQQQPPPQPAIHILPPPHTLIHPMPGPLPPGYQYAPPDYTAGGLPMQNPPQPSSGEQQQSQSPPPSAASGRTLSSSKRAEQNRKAQRAFRERRDQHVKALESRSQLLDAALASADEANRRWEECRALVDQLRVENAALRAALSQQAQLLPPGAGGNSNGAHQEEAEHAPSSDELKNDSADAKEDQE